MSPRPDSRTKMVASAAALLREQGLTGTSFGDVLQHSGAPRGSIYHHFPGGKTQLVEEAVGFSGEFIRRALERASEGDDPVRALRTFLDAWRQVLQGADFRAGCPVLAVAVEAPEKDTRLTDAAAAAFAAWEEVLSGVLRRRGVSPARARRLATLTVASLEGAVVLCRARRDLRALDDVGTELEELLRAALPG